MATGAGQGLPALLLLLLLRPCEASAGRPAGVGGTGGRSGSCDPALGATLSPQVSGRESACARPCAGRCPAEPPRCAPGVPAVLDGCSCCLVCARQRGESCSALLPCDESSGLYCDRGPEDGGGTAGICMVLEGDNCVFDGMIYRNGETFQPSCKYQCTCRDGQIGCLPRCNLDLLLPGPDCPVPRKVEVPGECCEKWICDPKDEVILGGFAMAAYRQEATLGIGVSDSSANCIEQTTEWSACSKSCGIGFSTRVTNRNQQCEMVKQTRLCLIRPCENEEPFDKKGKKCIRTKKSLKAIRFEYKNCTSVQTYKPRYCGLCNDGRCCTPHNTKTIQVEFRCPQGKVLKKPMMLINTCVCHNNCPQSNIVFFQPLDPTSNEAKI
ncbi:CCN family member 3 [Melopsittacus undulatus]|uniref:CCN family member 3 n=1 Tax=Melopsittacus undulatus TaxID=13146 RepID=A0A8V5GI46_MELUD|nr:CCN family member 3 [Melopsittacus undulatus]